jgi:hypothetical protein
MAAGLGFKTFATGDVLTAADTNGYLMQGTWVFADAAARTAAVTSPQEGNMSYLKDTNSTEYYSGSAWVAISGGASGGMTLINAGGTALTGASVVIGSIPATYKHLLITLKGIYMASAGGSVYLRLNADTGSNYAANGIRNIGTTIVGQFTQSQAQFEIISRNIATNTPRLLSNGTVWLMNYTDTDQISLTAQTYGTESTNTVSLQQTGVYDCSAAISSITLYGDFNFSGGTAYVYGVN